MVPAEELELKIYRFAEFGGKARWKPADLGNFANSLQFMEHAVLVDALHDLYTRRFMEFRQWSYAPNGWVPYAGQSRYFYRPFEMRVTFPGRKYFEGLEARSTESSQTAVPQPTRPQGPAEVNVTVQAKLDPSPQAIFAPPSTNPKTFVSHAHQDRAFVERLAGDLRAYGVDAWYFPWEIKPGDPIRQKIEEGLEGCEFFIIVISNASLSRPWVQTELDVATDRKNNGKIRKIIPIKIENCDHLPATLKTLCWEDFSDQPYESALKRVLDSIFDVDVRPPLGRRRSEQKE